MDIKFECVEIKPQDGINIILGQSHFIKTVEDIYEALVGSVPGIKFSISFCESSGPCLIRTEGNDEEMKKLSIEITTKIGAGHSFIIVLKNVFPINCLQQLKNVPEICSIYCASANPIQIIIAQTPQGRGIMGVIDGSSPKGLEKEEDIKWRKDFLRRIGYKL
jgi:adenosine/AMP kinase